LVAAGTLASAFWILSVNSWMHTPAGFAVNADGQFVPDDWWAVVFNPSFPYRFVHTVLAAYLTTAFVVGGVGAWHLLRAGWRWAGTAPELDAARIMFSMAMWMAALVAPLQILAGDMHGLNTFEHQPAKVAAMEGHYETHQGAPFIVWGFPDDEAEETRWAFEIPYLGSVILTHHLDGEVKGLKAWPEDERPKAAVVFWTFRLMIAIGVAMAALGLWGAWCRYKGTLYETPWLLRASVAMGPSGFVAVLAGWITTEVGRQPWTVYGMLSTADSVSPVDAPAVEGSLTAFAIVYFLVFGAGFFYLLRLMSRRPGDEAGPDGGTEPPEATGMIGEPIVEGSRPVPGV
jgi:cytochrome d ubiquinol oxidase subunit I